MQGTRTSLTAYLKVRDRPLTVWVEMVLKGSIVLVHFPATRPLLRQIEHIQSAHAAQASNWEKVETSLTQRLGESV